MILTKDNVKIGDEFLVVSDDKRDPHYTFKVGSIGRKYIVDENGSTKCEIGTDHIYHKDGIGVTERIFIDEADYAEYKRMERVRKKFWREMECCWRLLISEEDIKTIYSIIDKYRGGYKCKKN